MLKQFGLHTINLSAAMVSCSIFGCNSRSERKDDNISFHSYPTVGEIRNQWIKAAGRLEWAPTKYTRVCSKHFEPSCFFKKNSITHLNKESIPKLFLPFPSDETLRKEWTQRIGRKLPSPKHFPPDAFYETSAQESRQIKSEAVLEIDLQNSIGQFETVQLHPVPLDPLQSDLKQEIKSEYCSDNEEEPKTRTSDDSILRSRQFLILEKQYQRKIEWLKKKLNRATAVSKRRFKKLCALRTQVSRLKEKLDKNFQQMIELKTGSKNGPQITAITHEGSSFDSSVQSVSNTNSNGHMIPEENTRNQSHTVQKSTVKVPQLTIFPLKTSSDRASLESVSATNNNGPIISCKENTRNQSHTIQKSTVKVPQLTIFPLKTSSDRASLESVSATNNNGPVISCKENTRNYRHTVHKSTNKVQQRNVLPLKTSDCASVESVSATNNNGKENARNCDSTVQKSTTGPMLTVFPLENVKKATIDMFVKSGTVREIVKSPLDVGKID